MAHDDGLACLALIARYHHIPVEPESLRHRFAPTPKALGEPVAFGDMEILAAAKSLGLRAGLARLEPRDLDGAIMPAICKGLRGGYFLLLGPVDPSGLPSAVARNVEADAEPADADPADADPLYTVFLTGKGGGAKRLAASELWRIWGGDAILMSPRPGLLEQFRKFNLGWFVPSLLKYRALFAQVIFASFIVQLFGLVTPLFFQVVMDTVLVHTALMTLKALAIGFAAAMIFEVTINALRNYIFSHTTTRVDVVLGARLFEHLIHLPLAWYQARQAGQTVARVRELDSLRNFITSTALTLVIDLAFTAVYFAVMWMYSRTLTIVVLVSLPLYVILSVVITPILKRRLDLKFQSGARLHSFLTEAVIGVETIKSLALEIQMKRKWDNALADSVTAGFRAQNLGQIAGQIASLIQKLTTLAIIYLGAYQVMDGSLTVGQLVAFNMIAGRISGPILKLTQLWQDFQQAGISLERLGDILNTPTEPGYRTGQGSVARIKGGIRFEDVSFRYRPDAPRAVDGLTLEIPPGEIVGVAGASGSGKSTLAKLIQGIYGAESGRIFIDGRDQSTQDKALLRKQIGAVPQENVLFSGTVRENIAMPEPGVPLERVIWAAKTAGAHDFITELPDGYDTQVGERGTSMSGGQRQRLAIARALVMDPRVLVFDEATSALDYESERVIQDNMRAICAGRTVVIIAHRLSALKTSDRIVILDKGRILECGAPKELIARKGAFYRMALAQGLVADRSLRKPPADGSA
jgi:subfamily B ATP-binding cassette protein HlyB/CyaB